VAGAGGEGGLRVEVPESDGRVAGAGREVLPVRAEAGAQDGLRVARDRGRAAGDGTYPEGEGKEG
jgi:hypothetical protein